MHETLPAILILLTSAVLAVALFRALKLPAMLAYFLVGIMLGSIPLVGAWAASKWMIPWADEIGRAVRSDYKAVTQGWWAAGAILGSLVLRRLKRPTREGRGCSPRRPGWPSASRAG